MCAARANTVPVLRSIRAVSKRGSYSGHFHHGLVCGRAEVLANDKTSTLPGGTKLGNEFGRSAVGENSEKNNHLCIAAGLNYKTLERPRWHIHDITRRVVFAAELCS
jgi:hypothetical protein